MSITHLLLNVVPNESALFEVSSKWSDEAKFNEGKSKYIPMCVEYCLMLHPRDVYMLNFDELFA